MRAHDNHIIGYAVDGIGQQIVLHTENREVPVPHPNLDIVFDGVVTHQFRWANLVSILYGVRECPLVSSLASREAEIEAGFAQCGWPEMWRTTPEASRAQVRALEAAGFKFFEIDASIGFDGWIIAKGFRLIDVT